MPNKKWLRIILIRVIGLSLSLDDDDDDDDDESSLLLLLSRGRGWLMWGRGSTLLGTGSLSCGVKTLVNHSWRVEFTGGLFSQEALQGRWGLKNLICLPNDNHGRMDEIVVVVVEYSL
jgi:hypothetical protein